MPSDSYTLIISDAGVTTPISGSVTNASVASDAAISFSKLATLTSGNILVGNSANVPTSVALTGDINVSNTGVAAIATGVVVNADVNASAAIAYSKLASLTSGNILVGNSSNVPTSVGVTGDVTISNTGVTSIESGVIVNADINASAAIAHSKLASMSSGNILVGSSGSVPTSVAVTGDITVSNTGIAAIASGVIVNADINASAAIAHSKLASLTSGNILVGNGSNVPTSVAVTGAIAISNTGVTSLQSLGTPTSGTLTSCTGLPLTTGVTGILPVANGGTNQVSVVRGQISRMTAFTAVNVSGTGTYYPLTNAGTLDTTVSTNMTLGVGGTFSIKNTSGVTRVFRVYASVDATASNNDVLGIRLFKGTAGTLAAVAETECQAFTSSISSAAKLVTSWMISLAANEEIAVYVANHTAVSNITAQRARLIAEAVL